MDKYGFLVIFPIVIAIGNITSSLLLSMRSKGLWQKLCWSMAVFVLTCIVWSVAAFPYVAGLADSSASCLGQPGYPGCHDYEQTSALFGQTLGNVAYLLILLIVDLVIMVIGWYVHALHFTHRPTN